MIFAGGYQHPGDGIEWIVGGCGGGVGGKNGGLEPHGCGGYDELPSISFRMLASWPDDVPVVFIGRELGAGVRTGLILKDLAIESNPCRHAYLTYCDRVESQYCKDGHWASGRGGCSSSDSLAVLYAVSLQV